MKKILFILTFFVINISYSQNVPVANQDFANGMAFSAFEINVLENDYDPDNDEIEIWEVQGFGQWIYQGSIINNGSSITYASAAMTTGLDSIEYRIREVNDTTSISDWQKVFIDLSINPELPVLNDDYISVKAGQLTTINVLLNDDLKDFDSIFNGVIGANHGIGYLENQLVKYEAFRSFSGKDTMICLFRDFSLNPPLFMSSNIYIDVIPNKSFDSLNINNITAGVNSSGFLFCKIDEVMNYGNAGNSQPKFEFPAGSGKNTMFVNNMWVGGLDNTDSLHFAGERYRQVGNDFQYGPISDNYDSLYHDKWIRLWKLNKSEVDYHISHYSDNGYTAIDAIANWPGNGDIANGQADQLAPFFDNNNDQIYDPMQGDYPLIRGDQCILFICNDDKIHTESEGGSLGLEIHGMVYGYDEPNNPELNNSVFIHYDLINKSSNTYHDTYIGIFTDFDIGYARDDYVGCNVDKGSFYGYNGFETDGNGEPESYGADPPVQSVTILAGPFMDSNQIDDPDGGCDYSINGLNFGNNIVDDERYGLSHFSVFSNNFGTQGDPNIAPEYYNYLRGYWKDNTQFMFGGSGHISTGAVGPECRFMFPGNTDNCNWGTNGVMPNGGYNLNNKYWTEEEAGNLPDDRRGVGSMGPFTFKPGDVQEMELAYVISGSQGDVASTVNNLFQTLENIFIQVENGEIIVPNENLGTNENSDKKYELKLYPNPVKDLLTITSNEVNETEFVFDIYDMMGNLQKTGKIILDPANKVNVSYLKQGIYIIRIYNEQILLRHKFIKTQ